MANVLSEIKHRVCRMTLSIEYRRGALEDLTELRLARDLSVAPESIEFNVVGAGHEFWIAVENNEIIGLTVIGRPAPAEHTILYLHVSGPQKSKGVGSALIKAVIDSYPESEFTVVPFDGTEEFYRRLGFVKSTMWEMRKSPNPNRKP